MKKINKACSWLVIAAIFGVLTVGCSNQDQDNNKDSFDSMELLEVSISIQPSQPSVGQAITIQAKVTQAGKPVADADEVKFEVWTKGQDDHEMLEGKHSGKGIYTVEKKFSAPGDYYAVSHVTARTMHSMPKLEFKVSP